MRAIVLGFAAVAFAGLGILRAGEPEPVPLVDAVRQFNERCEKSGIGSLERARWMHDYRAAREAAAVLDEKNRAIMREQ